MWPSNTLSLKNKSRFFYPQNSLLFLQSNIDWASPCAKYMLDSRGHSSSKFTCTCQQAMHSGLLCRTVPLGGQELCSGKLCLLELLWVALPLIWRWYHCLKSCPLGIAFRASLGHTGNSFRYFIATPSMWPKMVLPSLMTHFIPQTWLWLTCLWAKITSNL